MIFLNIIKLYINIIYFDIHGLVVRVLTVLLVWEASKCIELVVKERGELLFLLPLTKSALGFIMFIMYRASRIICRGRSYLDEIICKDHRIH